MNLDNLLKKIEQNAKDEQTTTQYTVGGETYEVLSMTRAQKRDFIYNQKISRKDITAGDLIKVMIPTVYSCFQLKDVAVKAKADGLIVSYYDVVEKLFSADELLNIATYLIETNNLLTENIASEAIEEIKK